MWPVLQRHRRAAIAATAFVLTVVLTVIAGCRSSQPPAQPSQLSAPPTSLLQTIHNPQPPSPVELPFVGLTHPTGVAVDSAGNVYVTDFDNNRVLKLPAG